jgi:hypothetical protein
MVPFATAMHAGKCSTLQWHKVPKMRALIVTLLSVLSLGFVIETPETIRKRQLEEKKWQTELSSHYDFSALRKFLVREIDSRPQVEGVALSKSKIGREWNPAGTARICGDWLFWADSPSAELFKVSWRYERTDRKDGTRLERSVTFYCVRKSKMEFAVDRVERSDIELVILLP